MNRKAVSGIMLMFLLSCSFALTFYLKPTVLSVDTWWDHAWSYRRQVSITENSGYDLSDFPVEVIFEHNGYAQPDGDDIRMIDNLAEISSHLTIINGTHASVIFEIDVLASSTKTVYVYYGNPSAIAPSYSLVPLTISEGNTGYSIIDNSVYIGWEYCKWGWNYDNNEVVLWTDYKIDFDQNGDPTDDNDLITDVSGRVGGIGRYRLDYGGGVVRSIGLGNYQGFNQNPIFIDINFENATLRVYKNHTYVETRQADHLFMFSEAWDYANYGLGSEQNIIDGENVNQITPSPPWHYPWNEMYISPIDPQWMAYRNSIARIIFSSVGLNIGTAYNHCFAAKEGSAWDRCIFYDSGPSDLPLEPYDQPSDCRIYWYGDNSNYSSIEMMARIFHNQPSIVVGNEETLGISASLHIDPNTLNLESKGKWITAYIELPEGYDANNINVSTVMLNDTVPAEPKPIAIGDYDNDGIPDLMVKFGRAEVIQFIVNIDSSEFEVLTITGQLYDGTPFEGSDTIRVIT